MVAFIITESVNLDGKGRYFLHRNTGPLSFLQLYSILSKYFKIIKTIWTYLTFVYMRALI